jgi:hypothetical protein
MELSEILPKLQDWFLVADHKERQIKGGGRWYYLPHQVIRDRLNEICPGEWSTTYDGPHLIDGEPIYHCHLTICNVTRIGIGDKSNEQSSYGTAAQRAFRKAFTDAAEQFGIGAYLDEQTSEKTKRNFVQYMQSQGNGKAAESYRNQQSLEQGATLRPKPNNPISRPFGHATLKTFAPHLVTDAQRKRLYAIAIQTGKYTDYGFRRLVEQQGFASSKEITKDTYEELCDRAKKTELAAFYNQDASSQVSQPKAQLEGVGASDLRHE